MYLEDFSEYPQQYDRTYGGASGRKYDIVYQGEPWFLKFPGNIKYQVEGMSYANNSVSEYIGSKIYEMIGIDVHKTQLGVFKTKCVVACKDFVKENEFQIQSSIVACVGKNRRERKSHSGFNEAI